MAPAAPAAAPRRVRTDPEHPLGSGSARGKTATKDAPIRSERNTRALANARATQRAGAAPATRTKPARRKSGATAKPTRSRAAAAAPATKPSRTRVAAPAKKTVRAPAPSPVARVLNSRGMPLIDRVLRGPFWVVMLGVLLAGIVFLNVSVLELNRGIAQTDSKAATLERSNSSLRDRVAKLDSGERIQRLAADRGFVMPQPGDVTFVRPGSNDAKLASQRITAPAPATATTTITTPVTITPAPTTTTTVTPATTTTPTAPVQPEPTAQTAPVAQATPTAPPTTQVP